MKYIVFLSILLFSTVGCAATFHSPYYLYDDCDHEYIYVPVKKTVVVYSGSPYQYRYYRWWKSPKHSHKIVKKKHVKIKKKYLKVKKKQHNKKHTHIHKVH